MGDFEVHPGSRVELADGTVLPLGESVMWATPSMEAGEQPFGVVIRTKDNSEYLILSETEDIYTVMERERKHNTVPKTTADPDGWIEISHVEPEELFREMEDMLMGLPAYAWKVA